MSTILAFFLVEHSLWVIFMVYELKKTHKHTNKLLSELNHACLKNTASRSEYARLLPFKKKKKRKRKDNCTFVLPYLPPGEF